MRRSVTAKPLKSSGSAVLSSSASQILKTLERLAVSIFFFFFFVFLFLFFGFVVLAC